MSTDDAEFMLQLLNEPSWLGFIGDRGVRTLEDACAYILNGPVAMYARYLPPGGPAAHKRLFVVPLNHRLFLYTGVFLEEVHRTVG
jgi:hypothetical protein